MEKSQIDLDRQEAAAWIALERKCPGLVSWVTVQRASLVILASKQAAA